MDSPATGSFDPEKRRIPARMSIGKAITPTRLRLAWLAASLGLGLLASAGVLARERKTDSTDSKIRLLSQALEARDSGDYAAAKAKLVELNRLVPNDPQILRMLGDVERRENEALHPAPPPPPPPPIMDAGLPAAPAPRSSSPVPAATDLLAGPSLPLVPDYSVSDSAPVATVRRWRASPADATQLAADETARLKDEMDRVTQRLSHARDLVAEDRHHEALKELRQIENALPSNPMTEPLLRQIRALMVDVEHRLRVAAISLKDTPPVLSIRYGGDHVAGSAPPAAVFTPSVDVELELLELPNSAVDDLWAAWASLSRESQGRRRTTVLLDRNGRPEYQRPGRALLSPSQLAVYRAIAAGRTDADAAFAPLSDGVVGFSARFDPDMLVRTLASLHGCRLLASPRLPVEAGSPTILTLKTQPEQSDNGADPKQDSLLPSWKITLSPTAGKDARVTGLVFDLHASSYQGYISQGPRGFDPAVDSSAPTPESGAETIMGSTKSAGAVKLLMGETLVLVGQPQVDWPGGVIDESPLDRIPWFGRWHRAIRSYNHEHEMLLIVRLLPVKPQHPVASPEIKK